MKANELRIGNWLSVDGNQWHVDSIITNPFELYFVENPEYNHAINATPIPLTEEWLIKFEFIYSGMIGSEQITFTKGKLMLLSRNSKEWNLSGYDDLVNIKYVHQLQNLYFSLTGEELKQKGSF